MSVVYSYRESTPIPPQTWTLVLPPRQRRFGCLIQAKLKQVPGVAGKQQQRFTVMPTYLVGIDRTKWGGRRKPIGRGYLYFNECFSNLGSASLVRVYVLHLYVVCVCVCMCVYAREGERKRLCAWVLWACARVCVCVRVACPAFPTGLRAG